MNKSKHLPPSPQRTPPLYAAQRGIVLIMSLIMLVVISMLATMSMRNATSSEAVSSGVRTTALASQAAEAALRFCENTTVQISGGAAAPAGFNILPTSTPPIWQSTANWDQVTTSVYLVPLATVNNADGYATYQRSPECMIERVPVVTAMGAVSNTSTYVITARGFGPEVAATAGIRPVGSEVWLQSTIELN